MIKLINFILAAVFATSALAWEPTKPIEALIGFAPGSVNELTLRILAKEVEQNTGAKFVVLNRGGAGGVIATEELSKRPGDGLSISVLSTPGLAAMDKVTVRGDGRSYTTDSFVYPVITAETAFVIATKPTNAVTTVKQFVNSLNTDKASVAATGGARLVYEALSAKLKFNEGATGIVRVDHKGPVDALTDVVNGTVTYAIVPAPVANAFYKDNKIRIIAVSTNFALKQFPGVPTLASELPGFSEPSNWVLALPASTPAEIVDWYTREFTRALHSDAVKALYNENLLVERTDLTNSSLTKKWIQSREKQWEPLVNTVLSK